MFKIEIFLAFLHSILKPHNFPPLDRFPSIGGELRHYSNVVWLVWNDAGKDSRIRRLNPLLVKSWCPLVSTTLFNLIGPYKSLKSCTGWKEREERLKPYEITLVYILKNSNSFTLTLFESFITPRSQGLRVPWLLLFLNVFKKRTFSEIRASAVGAAVEQLFQLASPCRQALTLYLPSFFGPLQSALSYKVGN